MVDPDIDHVLLSAGEIEARVAAMARDIDRRREGAEITAVGVLTGGFVFLADLVRRLRGPVRVGFVRAASYGEGTRPGELTVEILTDREIEGRDVLLVEDIVDTGRSLAGLLRTLAGHRPRSLRTAVLLDKKARREVEVPLDHVGFPVPDEFLVGYGLDYAGRYRNLPYVGVLRRSVYEGGG